MATTPLKSIANLRKIASSLANAYGITRNDAAKIVRAYGPDAENYMRATRQGLTAQSYDLARGMGAFGSRVADPDTATRVIESIAEDPAFIRGVTAKDLLSIPEFKTYFQTYRNAVVDPATNGLRKKVGIRDKSGKLKDVLQESPRANTVTGKLVGTSPTPGDVTGSLVQAALANDQRAFARTLATRVSNQMALLRRVELEGAAAMQKAGFTGSRFYSTANDLQELVSKITGIPRHMVASAMAVASAGSSPYDELLKLTNIAPYIVEKNGKAVLDVDRAVKDKVIVSAKPEKDPLHRVGKALVDAVNGVDPLVDDFGGLALKTYQYRNMTLAPDIASISVSDRIAQRLAAGAGEKVDQTQGLIFAAGPDWLGSQAIGKAEGVTAAVPQELDWFGQRVSEVALPFNARRVTDPSFPFSAADTTDLILGVPRPDIAKWKLENKRIGEKLKQRRSGGVRPEVADLAQANARIGQVSAGTVDDITMLPPSMRTGINRDIVAATQEFSTPLAQLLGTLKTPSRRAYGIALPPAVVTLIEMAQRRNQPEQQENITTSAIERMSA